MIQQTDLILDSQNSCSNTPRIEDLPASKGNIPIMKNHMVYCHKCKYFVGATDEGDYWQCCRNIKHKIKKEVIK